MAPTESVQRIRIYLSQDDQWEGGPRYLALLEELRRTGATGATAIQGLAGFGPGHRSWASTPERPGQHQPVVIEWIDRAERITRILPLLDTLIADALVTIETITVHRATLRARGPFAADRSVGELMRRPAPAVDTEAPLAEALALMVRERLAALPVRDQEGRLAGLLTEQNLRWRAYLRLPPRLLPLLTAEEGAAIMATLAGRPVREVMSLEPRSVSVGTSIPQALVTMVEWGYAAVPVVDREGYLVGLFDQDHALRESVAQAASTPTEGAVRDAEPPTPVRLVMQSVAYAVPVTTRFSAALGQLVAAPELALLTVDAAGRLAGVLDGVSALRGLVGAERAVFLAALQAPDATGAPLAVGDERGLDGLLILDPPSIGPEASVLEAAQRLVELGAEYLAVVDAETTLLGIIGRGGLIRALLQQSE
jgi:CBS domain-containing protein